MVLKQRNRKIREGGIIVKIETKEVAGFIPALHGMRSPMNSWHLNDSCMETCYKPIIGEKDLDLAQRLVKAGSEHCKFLRQIQVWADFDMPLYWWSEFDTYKFNTKNSCSTMHKLLNTKKEIELNDFVYSNDIEGEILKFLVRELNILREKYLETKDFKYVIIAKRILPTSYKQKRIVNTNYAELRNIYFQRKNHRLKEEWQDVFCKWVESLPYAEELILYK